MFPSSRKREITIGTFTLKSVATADKCKKKRDARAKLLFCLSKPIALLLFSLPSSSSLRKLPSNSGGTHTHTHTHTHTRALKWLFFTASKKPSEFLVCLRPPFLSKSVQFLSHPARLQTTTLLLQLRRDEKRLLRGLTPSCLGFACSNFAKKNKRLLAENGISCVLIKNIYMSQIRYSYD